MMANMPIFQDMAAGLLAGGAKPAVSPEGEGGINFAALMAGVEAGKGEMPGQAPGQAPGQGIAETKRPDFVTTMLEQRHSGEGPNLPLLGETAQAGLPAGPEEAAPLDTDIIFEPQNPFATGKTSAPRPLPGAGALPEGTELASAATAGPEQEVKLPAAARWAQTASALPQMAMAMTEHSGPVEAEPTDSEEADLAEDSATQGKAPLTQGLALPLLQGLNLPPAAGQSAGTPASNGEQQSAMAAPVAGRSGTPGTLPGWATRPHAQAGGRDATLAAAPDAGRATGSRQALALELAASSLGSLSSDGAAAAGSMEATGEAMPATVVPQALSSLPSAPVAQPLLPAIPAADTAAMLGEQVIDMGVEGQWIDRMAREIADISAGTGRASFTLNPENLGRLQVEILQRDEGADVRLIAETDAAATALNQGRHQLQQDARLQAVRINDVLVERGQADRGSDSAFSTRGQSMGQEMAGQQGQSQAFHKRPLIEAVSSMRTGQEQDQTASARTTSQHARYA